MNSVVFKLTKWFDGEKACLSWAAVAVPVIMSPVDQVRSRRASFTLLAIFIVNL